MQHVERQITSFKRSNVCSGTLKSNLNGVVFYWGCSIWVLLSAASGVQIEVVRLTKRHVCGGMAGASRDVTAVSLRVCRVSMHVQGPVPPLCPGQ
jgi:hypothetical protein